jgi:RNA polymerase sigma-70 factor (ECF subfamily)
MSEAVVPNICQSVEAIYRTESRRVFATLIRLLGSFDLAEEALQDAFAAATEKWPQQGVPANPYAWLVSTGRFKAIDTLRRRTRFDASLANLAVELDTEANPLEVIDDSQVADDRLRLVFTCCHPALSPEAQVALTLREVCDLTTEEIASAFLVSPSTLAQRIVRAKAKIRDAGIPYQVPSTEDLPDRLETVLQVIYLVFNEGYAASSGSSLTRANLSGEAIRLGRLLMELLPDAEVIGLLALMLLQESRREARTSPTGDLILLADQDRSLWKTEQIAEGRALVQQVLGRGQVGGYTVQAAIASLHVQASSTVETAWHQIVAWYDVLAQLNPSPIVELNRAVAIAMRDGPAEGLQLVDTLLEQGHLNTYHLAHAARADLCRRLGKTDAARDAYQQALTLVKQEPERRFLEKRSGMGYPKPSRRPGWKTVLPTMTNSDGADTLLVGKRSKASKILLRYGIKTARLSSQMAPLSKPKNR